MARNEDEAVFRHLIAKIIRLIHDDPKFERVMLYAALEGHELAAMHHKQFAIPFIDMLMEYITRRQQEGALQHLHPGAVIFAAAGMAQQYATHVFMCDYKDAGFDQNEAIDLFTGILMNGINVKHTERTAA
jgi:AcrR family transcriptional regulator